MGRSKITSPSKDLITDNGAVLMSIVKGEQIHFELTLNWLTNLMGYTIIAKVQEANNDGTGVLPEDIRTGGVVDTLPILNEVLNDNVIKLVLPKTLGSNYAVQPKPGKPVYGFIDLEIADTGGGNYQQIWKPFRGVVEIRYSPTEA